MARPVVALVVLLFLPVALSQQDSAATPPPSPTAVALLDGAPNPLSGKALRCCSLYHYPTLFNNPSRPPHFLDGLAISYLVQLQAALNFSCASVDTDPLRSPPGTGVGFTAFIMELSRCSLNSTSPVCACELGVASWMMNTQRYGKVDYLPFYFRDALNVVIHKDNAKSSVSGAFFVTTFSPGVWAAIAGLVAVFTVLKMLDMRFEPIHVDFTPMDRSATWYKRTRHTVLKGNVTRRIRKSFQSTLSRMIGQGDELAHSNVSPSTRQWLLNFIILLCGLFFVLTYEATMTASLVQESIESEFRSFDDFQTCKIPAKEACLASGGAAQTFWLSSIANRTFPYSLLIQRPFPPLSSDCHKTQEGPKFTSSYEELIQSVANKSCKYGLMDGASGEYAKSTLHCGDLLMTGDSNNPGGGAFVLPRGSPYTTVLSNATWRLRQERSLESIEAFFARTAPCTLATPAMISLPKLRVFFIAAYVVCAILLLEMILDPQKPAPSPPKEPYLPPHPAQQQQVDSSDAQSRSDANNDSCAMSQLLTHQGQTQCHQRYPPPSHSPSPLPVQSDAHRIHPASSLDLGSTDMRYLQLQHPLSKSSDLMGQFRQSPTPPPPVMTHPHQSHDGSTVIHPPASEESSDQDDGNTER